EGRVKMSEQRLELLSEDELKRRQRRRTLRPYKRVAKKAGKVTRVIGKGVYDVAFGLGKAAFDGLNYLGKEGQKSGRRKNGLKGDKGVVKHRTEVYDIVARGRKIKVARAKVMARRKRSSKSRF
ncbi:hypothetical protein LCGC14_1918430, partial [marine sediment metagenome]